LAKNNKNLHKAACMTDIHFGKKSNSEQHNQDCIDFINWFCAQVKQDPTIDHIVFLGDWHENRSSLNISTLTFSYNGAKLLNELGLPVFFILGNHDLYHRHSRDVHSLVHFDEFENFILIDEPVIRNDIGNGVLFSPYLFHHEYPNLAEYLKIPVWFGHFEFRGFVITGYNLTMPTGPDPQDYQGPKHIISGHFHKRQSFGNVVYIGNTFPMDFSDAGDNERGMMIYNHDTDVMEFENWEDCPKYIRTNLSALVDKKVVMFSGARVKCTADININYDESNILRQEFIDHYKLREFVMEESVEIKNIISGTTTQVDVDGSELANINDVVIQMIQEIDSDHIDNALLIDIYTTIKIKSA
jgi:DNA repair exonuclease SbcCD nuclease subunit